MSELRLDAATIRNLAVHVRSVTGEDSPDMVGQVGTYLRAISTEGRFDEAGLNRAASILSNLIPHHAGTSPDGPLLEDPIGPERRLQIAVLDGLAARLGVDSEHLREAHDRLARLEASLRSPTPIAATLMDPTAGAIARTREAVLAAEAPTDLVVDPSAESTRWIVPALWARIFRPTVYFEEKPIIVSLAGDVIIGYLNQRHGQLEQAVTGPDSSVLLFHLTKDLSPLADQTEVRNLVNQTNNGGDNFLARILDGFAASGLVHQSGKFFNGLSLQELDDLYFPLWYALNRAREAVDKTGVPNAPELVRYFDQSLADLSALHEKRTMKKPPKVYNWKKTQKIFAALSREKVGAAFLSFRPGLEAKVDELRTSAEMPVRPEPVEGRGSTGSPRTGSREADILEAIAEEAVDDGSFSLPAEVTDAIRRQVDEMAAKWGSDRHFLQRAFERVFGSVDRARKDLPANSPAATARLFFWFALGIVEVLGKAARGHMKGDETLSDFNAELVKVSDHLMHAAGWDPQIDSQSLENMITAFTKAKSEGRYLILTSTHESSTDITAIVSLFRGMGIRFTYKKELLWVPGLNLIITATNMSRMDRVKPTGNSDVDGMARAHAVWQVDQVKEQRKEDGALNLAFTPGTRSRVGGVGEPKKGDANQAIDSDALVMVLTLFGTGQIMPTSWGRFFKQGAGVNRQVHVRVGLVDPREVRPQGAELVRSSQVLRRLQVQGVTDAIFEKQVEDHLAILTTLKERATPTDTKKANAERIQLNEFLDGFAKGIFFLEREETRKFGEWCRKHKVAAGYVIALWQWMDGGELAALFSRNKIKPTWDAMRDHRVGPWAISNALSRVKRRFVTDRKPAPIQMPEITYHNVEGRRASFEGLQKAYTQHHDQDIQRTTALLDSQMDIQSPTFVDKMISQHMLALDQARQPFAQAVREYIDVYENSDHPSYAPVSEATLALHRALASREDLFPGLDPDLRIWAFYTMEVYDRYLDSRIVGATDYSLRNRYFRMLGRGIRYRILNRINSLMGGDPKKRGAKDVAVAVVHRGTIKSLQELAEKIELAAELAAEEKTLALRLATVRQELANKEKGLGFWKKKNPMSYKAHVYKKLKHEEKLLSSLLKEFGQTHVTDILPKLAGEDFNVFGSEAQWATISDDASVAQLLQAKNEAERAWEEASKADFEKWAAKELEIYRLSFEAEAATHAIEKDIQVDRYTDLMAQVSAEKPLTPQQADRFDQALRAYSDKFNAYLEKARDIGKPDGRTKEYQRKQFETELFFAWLKLHWTVADIMKEVGYPSAGKLQMFSAMFPDQVEFLNNLSADQLEGLRPIVESLTFEQVFDLYFEALMAGNDPRVLDRLMGRLGLDATAKGAGEAHIYGAGVLAGALGQSSGADLVNAGASVLADEQAGFGVVPQMMAFSPNHQGFSDYTFVVAFLASLGLGRPWVVYEAKNFDILPVYGTVLGGGDGIGFERDAGGAQALQLKMSAAIDRGISPVGFDHGTRRMATTPNPFAKEGIGSLTRREFLFGGSIAEIAHAAHEAGIPIVPVYQDAGPFNHDPDIGLSGKIREKNFDIPWSIHAGGVLRGPALMAFGEPTPGSVMPEAREDFERMGIPWEENHGHRAARQVMAAHTEVRRLGAFTQILKDPPPAPQTPSRGAQRKKAAPTTGRSRVTLVGSETLTPSPVHLVGSDDVVEEATTPRETTKGTPRAKTGSVARHGLVGPAARVPFRPVVPVVVP